jgi:histone-lysine N-methyltransferase SETD7
MGLKPIYPFIIDPLHMQHNSVRSFTNNGIAFIGIFRNGKADGPVWYGMVGEPHIAQGFLYGQLNKKGKLTGDNIAYIYPDYVTALVGKFEDKIMKSGRESTITQMTCKDGIIQASFSQPAEDSVEFFYDPSNNKYMGAMPLVRDPYEKKNVELQESRIPGAGHGIFAIRNILKGQVCTVFNKARLLCYAILSWSFLTQVYVEKKLL